jgi:glucosamine--fructose-6-phosphate aminotransferase (isomerizing)
MCGIFGYIGNRDAVPIVLEGLKSLEYRGYDSAGVAVVKNGEVGLRRCSGKLSNLKGLLASQPLEGNYGLGHTRWATHGRPTEENAHPHRDCKSRIVVVHNGIIENYLTLKRGLTSEGHQFTTETDTEVIAHLIEKYFDGNLESAVIEALKELRGLFAFSAISADDPQKIVTGRDGPPSVVGRVEEEGFVASDVPALLPHTRDVLFLDDGEIAVIEPGRIRLMDFSGKERELHFNRITWDPVQAEKGGFKHFMLKEIYEQPTAVSETLVGRLSLDSNEVRLDDVGFSVEEWLSFKNVCLIGCGTSWHSGLAGKYMIESLARIPVQVDYGSEFRYRNPVPQPDTLCVVITQSGETADALAAQRKARDMGMKILTITNVVGSMTTRLADGVLHTRAGPEIGVASTKAFATQLTALYMLALQLGRVHGSMTLEQRGAALSELTTLPHKLEKVLELDARIETVAKSLFRSNDFLFLGRGVHFPIALEGALKLKEISYIHAEGYPAGEMKHGPNALIDGNLPVVFVVTQDKDLLESQQRYEKVLNNIREVKSRDGIILSVGIEGDEEVAEASDHYLPVPASSDLLLPILEVVPLQLLAYRIAILRGCDVDQPRNLAKSVTVE